MPRNLGNREDVERTSKAAEGHGGQSFLSIPDSKTPWRLLTLDYADSFVHWVEINGNRRPVRCGGGIDGEGFKPDDCPVCQHMLSLYQDAKAIRADGDAAKADKMKDHANQMRGQLQVIMKAVRGQYALMKDPKTKKKYRVADWDTDDKESNVEVGLLSLSKAQWEGLTGLIGGEGTEFIENPEDLLKYTLFTSKEKRKGRTSSYSAVVWGAEEEESEMPDIEIPEEIAKVNLDDFCEIDHEELAQVYQAISGQTIEDPEDDEEVEMEADSDDDDVDEDYLSDVEGEDEESEEFEDDIPYDEDDEEEEEPAPKKAPVKKAPVKKPAPVKKSTGTAKRSGKTRL